MREGVPSPPRPSCPRSSAICLRSPLHSVRHSFSASRRTLLLSPFLQRTVFFFLFSRSVRSVCTTGPRVLRSSVQTNGRMLSASLSLFFIFSASLSLFLSLSIPFLSHPPFSPILRDTVPALLFQLLVPASFSRAYSRPSPPPSFLSLYSLCLHSSHDD